MFSTLLSTLLGKLAIGTVALAATTSGLAATDNLPDPAQQWVSDVVSHIGIDIPAPSDLPDQVDGVEPPEAPELPEDAADIADGVIGTVFEGDSTEGRQFGEDVADTASDGSADVADEYTGDAGSQADLGAENADEYTGDAGSQADLGAENADDAGSQGDGYRP